MFGYPLSLYLSLVSSLFLWYDILIFKLIIRLLVKIIFQVIPVLRKNKNITITTTTTTIIIINIKWPVILVLYCYIARREYVNSRWINVKCSYIENQYNIENQAFCWKGLIELTQFTQNEPTTW